MSRQALELSLAAPQVVAHRMARMAAASMSPTLSMRDRREFNRMGSEKLQALQESWMAIGLQAWRAQFTLPQAWFSVWMQLIGAGFAPVHRKVVANARRLGRRRD